MPDVFDRTSPAAHAAFRAQNQRNYGYDGSHAGANAMDARDSRFLVGRNWRVPLAMAALFTGGGALTAGGGAAASAAPTALPASSGSAAGAATGAGGMISTAPAASRMSRLGSLFNSDGFSTLVGAGLNLYGQRQSNRANDQARSDQLTQYREGLALQRRQLELENENADLDRDDARALNAAINDLRRRELEAAEEQREFERGEVMYQRGRVEQRDARLAPYRQTSTAANARLASLWGLG